MAACLVAACAWMPDDPLGKKRAAEQAALAAAAWPESPPAPGAGELGVVSIRPPVPKPPYKAPPAEGEDDRRLASVTLDGDTRTASFSDIDLKRLVGLSQTDTFAMLGTPAEVREQSPATVWSYDVGGCQLDLYFYMDLGTNAFRVLTFEMRNAVSGEGAKSSCPAPVNAASRAR